MKKVIVTGASGFIGRNSLSKLLSKGYEVHAISFKDADIFIDEIIWHKCNLLEPREINSLIKKVKPSHLLHFAWDVTPGYRDSLSNFDWVQTSIELLKKFYEYGGKRVVTAGTCFQYSETSQDCQEFNTLRNPLTFYGKCKQSFQYLMEAFCKEAGLSSAWGHIFFLYGPYEASNRLVSSVIISLLKNEIANCTEGNQIRDFMHVEDVADAFAQILDSDVEGPINVASGYPVKLRDIVEEIAKQLGKIDLVNFGGRSTPQDEFLRISADVTRLKNELNWEHTYNLSEGIKNTIDWWKKRV